MFSLDIATSSGKWKLVIAPWKMEFFHKIFGNNILALLMLYEDTYILLS